MGGDREAGVNQEIVLDGGESYDPSTGDSSTFSFIWTCKVRDRIHLN